MGMARFPLPEEIHEVIALLNASHVWHTSLRVDEGGTYVIDGDQLMFTAQTHGEAKAFLAGCFLATYFGRDLKEIKQEIADRYEHLSSSEAAEELEREQRSRRNRQHDSSLSSAQDGQ